MDTPDTRRPSADKRGSCNGVPKIREVVWTPQNHGHGHGHLGELTELGVPPVVVDGGTSSPALGGPNPCAGWPWELVETMGDAAANANDSWSLTPGRKRQAPSSYQHQTTPPPPRITTGT